MAEERTQKATDIRIVPMEPEDAPAVGRLHHEALPWSIFSKMGPRFAGGFTFWIHQQKYSRIWVAKNAKSEIIGMIGSTLDRPGIYRKIVKEHAFGMLLSVLANLYRPGVVVWLFRAIGERLRPPPEVPRSAPRPVAEGLFLAVLEEAKGSGLARRLVEQMESQFRAWGFVSTYVIVTLSTNKRANRFYQRIGAKLVAQVPTRGHLIYEYHKTIPPSDTESHMKV